MLLSAICCGLCIITVALSSPISAYADNTSGETKNTNSAAEEEYKNQLADLQDKQKDIMDDFNFQYYKKNENIENLNTILNDKIKNAKSEKAQLQAKANSLDEQISITRDQMELCQNRINVTQDYISAKQAEIDKKETDI